MDVVLRAALLYLILMVLMRLSGRRTLAELTSFDLILLLIVAEVTDNMLLGQYSFVSGLLAIVTLISIDIALSIWKQARTSAAKWLDGTPVIVVEHGRLLKDRMNPMRVSLDDIMESARETQGVERLDQIKYAVVEANGKISIIRQENGE